MTRRSVVHVDIHHEALLPVSLLHTTLPVTETAQDTARKLKLLQFPESDVRLSGPFNVGHVKLYMNGFTYSYPVCHEADASIVAWVCHHDNDVAKNRAQLMVTLLNEITGYNE